MNGERSEEKQTNGVFETTHKNRVLGHVLVHQIAFFLENQMVRKQRKPGPSVNTDGQE